MEMQLRVRLRYNYAWRKYRDMQDADYLQALSPSLSTDIATTLYLDVLHSVRLFQECTEDMLRAITEHLCPQFFLTGDVFFREGSTGDNMFFIEKGVVKLQL